MDLGQLIIDYKRFKDCNGAPIIYTRGWLISFVTHELSTWSGITTHGDTDIAKPVFMASDLKLI